MRELTSAERIRLDAVIAELRTLPTPEFIVESVRIRLEDSSNEEHLKRYRAALAGAIAARKVIHYLTELRSLMDRIVAKNREIGARKERSRVLKATAERTHDLGLAEQIAQLEIGAIFISGEVEVLTHLFTSCVSQLWRLLQKASSGIGFTIPPKDLAVLRSYWNLRNYFEHVDQRMPGEIHAYEVVTETVSDGGLTIESGLKVDHLGRYIVKGIPADVTSRGVRAIEDVIQRTWEQITEVGIAEVERFFTEHPLLIPDPRHIQQGLLTSVDWPDSS